MAADMDPNDQDTVHYLIFIPYVGGLTVCRQPSSRRTADSWENVTCRMCVFIDQQNRAAG